MKQPFTNLPVIDSHTHLFPPVVAGNRNQYAELDSWFSELYGSHDDGLVSPEEMLASMDAAGVERSVVCGWPWRDHGLCREHNDFLAELVNTYPNRFSWLGIVNLAEQGAAAEVERCASLGACGIGELNADAQGFRWTDARIGQEAMSAAVKLNMPVLIHCSEPVGHAYPGKGTATPDQLLPFIAANTELRIVAAHWGGGLPFYELMPEVARACRNVFYDSAASTYLYQWDVFSAVERIVGSKRILFGTDYPLLKQSVFLKRTLEAGISHDGLPSIMSENAAAVFGLTMKEV